jgi:hypothetical protein
MATIVLVVLLSLSFVQLGSSPVALELVLQVTAHHVNKVSTVEIRRLVSNAQLEHTVLYNQQIKL